MLSGARLARWLSTSAVLYLAAAIGCTGAGTVEDGAAAPGEDEGPPEWMRQATEQPRGLLRNDPGAAPGYVLFSQFTSDLTYLVDLEGQVVHTWKNEKAGSALYLKDNGNLLRLARMPEPPNFRSGGVAGYIQELSWDGDVVWEWKMGDEHRMLHHDIEPLPNGNVLAIAWESKTAEEARAFLSAQHDGSVSLGYTLARRIDFTPFRCLLDLGGGAGTYTMEIFRAYPHLQAIIFDFPQVCQVAADAIQQAGLSAR